MFMCRSLEEFREAYLRILREDQQQPPPVDNIGAAKVEPRAQGETSDDDDDDDHQPKRFRLVVKREEY